MTTPGGFDVLFRAQASTMGDVRSEVPPDVLGWLDEAVAGAIDENLVPGASESERKRLAALGGLARALSSVEVSLLPEGVSQWTLDAKAPPDDVVSSASHWINADPDGALADLYAGLVVSGNRRRLGTFFTPSSEARLMLRMWSDSQDEPDEVVDIGAGVGVFTAAARTEWESARVIAVDVNPVTLGLLALHPHVAEHLCGQGEPGPGIELALDDFTSWITDKAPTGTRRLYLGNPPYTRAQLLPREERARLHQAAGRLCGGRASLSTVITALCLLHMRPKDGLCLLLPAQWLESDYASRLREYLWAQRTRRLELRLVDSGLFADAQVDAVALLVGSEQADPQPVAIGGFEGATREIKRDDQSPANWRALFREAKPTIAPGTTPGALGDLAQVRRGLATGANAFFLLSASEAKEHDLPESVLHRALRRLHSLDDTLPDELYEDVDATEPRFVLMARQEDRQKYEPLDTYLRWGEELGYDQRELCKLRQVWFDVAHDAFTPDVIVSAMTRGQFRVVTNDARAIITNNLYGLRWKDEVTSATRKAVVAWMRSDDGQEALRSLARSQGDGLFKLEPKALRQLRIPMEPQD